MKFLRIIFATTITIEAFVPLAHLIGSVFSKTMPDPVMGYKCVNIFCAMNFFAIYAIFLIIPTITLAAVILIFANLLKRKFIHSSLTGLLISLVVVFYYYLDLDISYFSSKFEAMILIAMLVVMLTAFYIFLLKENKRVKLLEDKIL